MLFILDFFSRYQKIASSRSLSRKAALLAMILCLLKTTNTLILKILNELIYLYKLILNKIGRYKLTIEYDGTCYSG